MISKKTVFVLGAGASAPYGFPSGAELRAQICKAESGKGWLCETLQKFTGINPNETRDFARAFLRSGIQSIDAFLVKRKEFIEIGKLTIAIILAFRENKDTLINENIEDNWYRYLWQFMVTGADTPGSIINNKVRFLSFNYDRSLESFLHISIQDAFGIDSKSALDICNNIPLIHLYGQLGRLDHTPSEDGRTYDLDLDHKSVRLAANGITLIQQARDDSKNFEKARDWFEWAERIYFLGFGFDETNCKRLDLPAVLNWKADNKIPLPLISASTLGLTTPEEEKAKKLLTHPMNHWRAASEKNTDALRKTILLE